jgi:hypothetical protein
VKLVELGGRGSDSHHRSIGTTPGASHRNHLFPSSHTPTIYCHEDDFNTDLHPLAEGPEKSSHDTGHSHTIEAISVKKHGAEVNKRSVSSVFLRPGASKYMIFSSKYTLFCSNPFLPFPSCLLQPPYLMNLAKRVFKAILPYELVYAPF